MAIDLLHSFFQRGNQVTSNTDISAKTELSSKEISMQQSLPANQQILRAIKALQAGQTLQGEVLSVKQDQVQLEILKQVVIEARLSGALNLVPGTNMTFQVKGNMGGSLSLIPLFTNTSTDPNILKALDMAGISINDRTTQMVQSMMEKGMSVNKQSLMEMYREVVTYKEAPVSDIVSLKQMQMPITKDNLQQFSVYKNNQHFLTEGFSQMGKNLGSQLEQWISEGKPQKAIGLLQELKSLFDGFVKKEEGSAYLPEGNKIPTESSGATGKELQAAREISQEVILSEEGIKSQDEKVMQKELLSLDSMTENKEEKGKIIHPFEKLIEIVKGEKVPDKVSALFERVWNREVKEQWLLKPEDIAKKENLSKLYEKLDRQIQQLEQILEEQVSKQSPVIKTVQSTAANIDFMNQLNQMHAYIQLPLKMMNQNASGELYVFTNKRNLQEKDGKITALLHLDMEYLGKMDIHVALENHKVATHFYLEKEEYLDFLESHMELLTERLNKRGYDCTLKATLREGEGEEGILTRSSLAEKGQTLLSTQAFDMRA